MKYKQSFDWLWITLTVLWPGWAMAQGLFEQALEQEPQAEPKGEADMLQTSKLEFNGFVRGDLFIGKVDGQDVTEIKTGFAEAAGKLRMRFSDWGAAWTELRFRRGWDGSQVSGEFDLREAYVDAFLGPIDLRLGHQIIVWGRADGINPTNNLTPLNMRVRSPDEDDRRAANLALRVTTNVKPARWEVIYVPFYAPSFFPAFTLPGGIVFADPDYPDADFEHGILATRLNVELPAIDYSISYLFGYSTFPGLGLSHFNFTPGSMPEVGVQFTAYQHHVIGADFQTTVSDWFGLRGEIGVKVPKDHETLPYAPLPEIQYVLGVDREFGDLSVLAQYVGKVVWDFEEIKPTGLLTFAQGGMPTPEQLTAILLDPESAARTEVIRKYRMVTGQQREVSHSIFVRLGYKMFQDTLTLELAAMRNFTTAEWMYRPKVSYDITDGLTVIAGGEIYLGEDDTLYGTIDQSMSAGFLEMKASF